MARSFQDVLREVSAKSDPQRKIVLSQIAALPAQQKAEEDSLAAQKDQAFEDILGGARRRGLGFSGIPLGEQAEYAATDYAPAVARLKTGFGERRGTLESALADIGRSDYMTSQDIFARDRAFNYQKQQDELNRRAAARQASIYSGLSGGNNKGGGDTPSQEEAQIQNAYNDVQKLLATKDGNWIQKNYTGIKKSAANGNKYDKLKLQFIEQLFPGVKSANQILNLPGIGAIGGPGLKTIGGGGLAGLRF